jgi:ABC-type lipoprotein release transport system permease subunit
MSKFSFGSLVRVSWRSIWRNWRRTFITVSAISGGLGLSLFLLAFQYGIHNQVITDAVKIQSGHITLENKEYRDAPAVDLWIRVSSQLRNQIAATPGVASVKAVIQGQGVAKSGSGAVGVAVMGIEASREKKVSPIALNLIDGDYLEDSDKRKVVVGSKLAEQLKLKVGKKLVLSSNDANGELVEQLFRVKGIFEMHSPEMDGHLIQIPIKASQKFYGLSSEDYTQLGVVIEDRRELTPLMGTLQGLVDVGQPQNGMAVLSWETVLADLAALLDVDRAGNWFMLLILVFLSLFTIWNTILMSVLERTREFAMMMALGTSPFLIRAQVFVESLIVGIVSVGVGLGLGGGLALWFRRTGIDLSAMLEEGTTLSGFTITPICYPKPEPQMFWTLGAIVLGAVLLISFFSSLRVNRISVADVLR